MAGTTKERHNLRRAIEKTKQALNAARLNAGLSQEPADQQEMDELFDRLSKLMLAEERAEREIELRRQRDISRIMQIRSTQRAYTTI